MEEKRRLLNDERLLLKLQGFALSCYETTGEFFNSKLVRSFRSFDPFCQKNYSC